MDGHNILDIDVLNKRVHFKHSDFICEFEDTCELREYRKPYWELFAINRVRFHDRVQSFEKIFNSCYLNQKTQNLIPNCLNLI